MAAKFCRNIPETPEPLKAEVSGSIPLWLQGTLLRNGPGLFSIGNTSFNHWFDGMSLIHSFTFKHGEVYYRSKFLRSNTYLKNISANKIVVSEFGTMVYPDPCKNIFSKFFTHMLNSSADFTDNNLVNFIRYGDDYYASSEVNIINQIDPLTLDTVGRVSYKKYISLNLATAHPHYDEEGNTYNMGTAITPLSGPKFVIFKICSIPFRSKLYPSYFHSFGMTENYIIFVEQPFKLDIIRLITAYFRGVTWGKCLFFDQDDDTLFHIINRKTGVALKTKFCSAPFVVFHHINAYEEDDHVVFDMITYKDSNVYDFFYIDCMKQETEKFIEMSKTLSPPVCQRFVIPVNADLKIAKVDTYNKTHIVWSEEDCYPSEPKFVASPDAVDEDDGVILSSVVSTNPSKSSFMLVLDAKTLKEIARATINATVHLDLHGLFIPQASEMI
ncbi:Beta,beta-carotene 15,15'-dioxygenase [Bagarius yarrelli]|uniref:Beta,beta-carotene 15,15'-dioxygenase n=1 Tax=Bagarius yarrelli TaxID=175774 RepID=A0A556U0W2_BAGYA|nr:Beta,beta-carotene 15,15'-dioxygenase [Bagarius yarrelli]